MCSISQAMRSAQCVKSYPSDKASGAFCSSNSLFMGNAAVQEGVDSARSEHLFTSTGAGSTQHLS